MKKFIIRVVIFFTLIFVIDKCLGCVFEYLQNHSKGGETQKSEFIAKEMNDSILIFGSSRANHHYDPIILGDSLGIPVYNCGLDGNGIIFSYGQYTLFKDRYVPKAIICEIMPEYDLLVSQNNERYIAALRPYYNNQGIDSIFFLVDPTEYYKMISKTRRYNQKFLYIVKDYIQTQQNFIKGYESLEGEMDYDPLDRNITETNLIYDDLKLYFWKRFFEDTKERGTKVILMGSPIFHGMDSSILTPLLELADDYNIPFVDYYNDSTIINEKKYFKDRSHLNREGAEKFTKEIVDTLRSILQSNGD